MKEQLEQAIADVVQDVLGVEVSIELTRPEEQFGDYATNVALQLSKQVGRAPREIAEELAAKLRESLAGQVSEVTVAGPGFLNFRLSDDALHTEVNRMLEPDYGKSDHYKGQTIVAEYSDPNPFKVLHAGHLYTTLVGDGISRLLEAAGGEVHRVNFGGDVGLHVGKTMWAILKFLGGEHPEKLNEVAPSDRLEWLSARYVEGNNAYEDDEQAKAEIVEINKQVYTLHDQDEHGTAFAQIYWMCRDWSYEGFNKLYDQLQVSPFEKYYPESVTTPLGIKTVEEGLEKGIFEKSEGAVVYKGEKDGLHTRVFLNSHGLPTYEAKDLGLAINKWNDYQFDFNFIITGNDIVEYMKVVLAALSHFHPEVAERTRHLTHGNIKLAGGIKMSSRKGNILRAEDVLEAATTASEKAIGRQNDEAVLGAVKYAFLKQRIGADIIYDPEESVSLQGNSGPYLQYAHARACSILRKAGDATAEVAAGEFTEGERSLVRKLGEYPEVVALATNELLPHHICTYLYELAQVFNRFYEHNRVIGDDRQATRLTLVKAYRDILGSGLSLLGIAAPESM